MDLKDVGVVEAMNQLKLNHQFNEKDVPEIFQNSIHSRIYSIEQVNLDFYDSYCLLEVDFFNIRFEKNNDNWTVTYKKWDVTSTIGTVDPEKSIIDHLWFVLKNPKNKLGQLNIIETENSKTDNRHSQKIDSKKLYTLLQSMIDSIDHQIQTRSVNCEGFNEDMFFSFVKHVKPGTLQVIRFNISWKEEGNYQKIKEIVELDQWKQAKQIFSSGVTPLKIDDFLQYELFLLRLDRITPEDVLRVVENAFNASSRKCCRLICKTERFDIKPIINFLRSQNDGSKVSEARIWENGYDIVKSGSDKRVLLVFDKKNIAIC